MTRNALTLLLGLVPATALAHGGGLDANGCHTNRKTGDYHCHRAPASSSSDSSSASPRTSSGTTALYSQPVSPVAQTAAAQGPVTGKQLVQTVQLLLVALGYSPGKADGIVSPATTSAIRRFQSDSSLTSDGLVSGTLLVRLAEQIALRAKTS